MGPELVDEQVVSAAQATQSEQHFCDVHFWNAVAFATMGQLDDGMQVVETQSGTKVADLQEVSEPAQLMTVEQTVVDGKQAAGASPRLEHWSGYAGSVHLGTHLIPWGAAQSTW
jgi:hypothetical protein